VKLYIREVQKFFGLSRSTILYYEKKGILSPVHGENGYREYSEEDMNALFKIMTLRKLGYSSGEIEAQLKNKAGCINMADLQAHAQRLREEIQEKEQLICRIEEFMTFNEGPTLVRPSPYYISRSPFWQPDERGLSISEDEIDRALIRSFPHADVCCLLPVTCLEEEEIARLPPRAPGSHRGVLAESVPFLGISTEGMIVFAPSLCLRVWSTWKGYRETLSTLGEELRRRGLRAVGDICIRNSPFNVLIGHWDETRVEILVPVEQVETGE